MRSEHLDPDLFRGRTALVTGGGSGINRGIARMLAGHGARVVVVGRTREKLEETCRLIAEDGGEALALDGDVRDFERMKEIAAEGARHFSPYSLVVAGAAGNFLAPAAQLSGNGFSAVVDIDLKGSFHTFRACFDHFADDNVRCLAISAPQAQVPMPMQSHVCAAKSAIEMLVKSLAIEWGPRGVRVNALSPGYVEGTVGGELMSGDAADQIRGALPLPRFTTVQEMAQMACVLMSPLTDYMTGQVVALDGGVSLLGASGMMQQMGMNK